MRLGTAVVGTLFFETRDCNSGNIIFYETRDCSSGNFTLCHSNQENYSGQPVQSTSDKCVLGKATESQTWSSHKVMLNVDVISHKL